MPGPNARLFFLAIYGVKMGELSGPEWQFGNVVTPKLRSYKPIAEEHPNNTASMLAHGG